MAPEVKRPELDTVRIRVVSATLQRVEKGLDRVERLLMEAEGGATYRFRENLTGVERAGIRHLCRRLRAAVAMAGDSLHAEVEDRSLPREIREEVAALGTALRETKGALKQSGPLSHEEDAMVDQCLGDVASGLVEILHLLKRTPTTDGRHARTAGR